MKKCKCNRKKGIVCDYHFFPRTRAGYERFLLGKDPCGVSYPH